MPNATKKSACWGKANLSWEGVPDFGAMALSQVATPFQPQMMQVSKAGPPQMTRMSEDLDSKHKILLCSASLYQFSTFVYVSLYCLL